MSCKEETEKNKKGIMCASESIHSAIDKQIQVKCKIVNIRENKYRHNMREEKNKGKMHDDEEKQNIVRGMGSA